MVRFDCGGAVGSEEGLCAAAEAGPVRRAQQQPKSKSSTAARATPV